MIASVAIAVNVVRVADAIVARQESRWLGSRQESRWLGARQESRWLGSRQESRWLGSRQESRWLGSRQESRWLGSRHESRWLGARHESRVLGHLSVWRRLAGADTTARGGLPVHELLAPLPVIAIALLVVNDRLLKGSAAPEWLTGKLSDVTGVFVFPLAAVAIVDLIGAGLAKLGLLRWDYTLRRWKLAVAIGFTALVFGAMKLSSTIGGWVERAWSSLVPSATIYPDPTDAFALIVLVATWWHGRRAIARGAYGRLALARARHLAGKPLPSPFGDAVSCGADPAQVRELDAAVATWLGGGGAAAVDTALSRLRE